MTLETFFEKFDQFADAPDAVAKMRELVLELAVRGRLLSSGNLDSSAPFDPSAPFPIPHDWQWIALNQAADCRAAAKVDSSSLNDSDWVLDLEDIDGGAGKVIATATFAERRSLSTKASFQKGDVLYGKLRPYLNKVVIAERPGFCTTEIIPLRPQKFVAAGYLRLFLRSPHFLRYAAAKNYGMKMPRLGTQDLESAAIPLPPLTEQKRIVAKVDELMALCDRLESQQQERETRHASLARASLARFADAPTPANLDFLFHPSYAIPPADLRKSILTLAVQGKIVPQDPNDEPAEKLVAKLGKERRRFADTHKFRAPIGEPVDDSSVPFTIPETWKWSRLSSVFNAVTDGDHLPPPKSDTGIAFLTIGNITTGALDFEGCRFVPDSYYQGLADFRRPIRGDILYTVVGATYGRPALVESDRPFCVQRHIAILKPSQSVDVGFLIAVLRSPLAYNQASASTTGTAQPTIPLGSLRNFTVPVPPLAEQRRIVAKVEQMMALVDALETQLAASRATAANLLSALVAELTAA
jgi:type I restriction enzyme S subunit